jgi:anti-sigma-K factor RskA
MKYKSIVTLILISLFSFPVHAQTSEKEILQACRSALIDLQRAREVEAALRIKVIELEGADKVSQERIKNLESAIAKYEAAITARTQAEALVSELRANYEKQLAVVEKQLAIEQQKTSFWRTMARVGVVTAVVVGAAVGYVIGSK